MILDSITMNPLFGVGITFIIYLLSLKLSSRKKWIHPLFLTSVLLILILYVFKIPYEAYRVGGDLLVFLLGPATVALGVPLYKQLPKIKKYLIPLLTGITLGSLTGLLSAGLLVWTVGGTKELILTMLPKSVTAPVSIEIVRQLGGYPELAAVFTVLTGLLGSMIGPFLLKKIGIKDDISIGLAMGTAAHGIGTARVIRDSEIQGSYSGFAMGMAAIITSVLIIPLYWFFL